MECECKAGIYLMYLIVIFSVLFVYNLFHVEFSKRLFCFSSSAVLPLLLLRCS